MNSFSISDLQQYSGIKAHTIRMWEKRYRALKPGRSMGNTRYYDNSQLRRLLNIVSLLDSDSVSNLCSMPDSDLYRLIGEQLKFKKSANPVFEFSISQMISAAMDFDEKKFNSIYAKCKRRYGLQETYLKVLYPALNRVGVLWAKNDVHPAQEHFITNLIKQKIYSAINELPVTHESKKGWLLFLPEDEHHELGLIFSDYVIRRAGRMVVNLGANLSFESLLKAVKSTGVSNLLFFLVRRSDALRHEKYIRLISGKFPGKKIYVGCDAALGELLKVGRNVKLLHSVQELQDCVK